jgi:uncharacterized protein involved in outer membrane biogenesis
MGILKSAIERKLSAALGARVTFEKLNFSLMSKSVEAFGVVVVTGRGDSSPLLTVRRVKAEVSVAAAFKKEIVVKSLAVEGPVVMLTRGTDGTLNLPMPGSRSSDTVQNVSDSSDDEGDDGNSWKFEAKKILVVDGEIHFRDAGGYDASAEKLLAELKASDAGPMDLTVMADSVGRRDHAVELGQLRLNGKVSGVTDLSDWSRASTQGSVHLGDILRAQVGVSNFRPPNVKTQFTATLPDLALVLSLLPSTIALPPVLRSPALSGKVDLAGIATFDGKALCVPELSLQAKDVRVKLVPPSEPA